MKKHRDDIKEKINGAVAKYEPGFVLEALEDFRTEGRRLLPKVFKRLFTIATDHNLDANITLRAVGEIREWLGVGGLHALVYKTMAKGSKGGGDEQPGLPNPDAVDRLRHFALVTGKRGKKTSAA